MKSQGYKFLLVTLTGSPNSCSKSFRRHVEELRKRIKRKFHYDIEIFKTETREGPNGVLHLIFACKTSCRFQIPNSWLSEQWLSIHNSRITNVKQMSNSKDSIKHVAGYFAGHDDIKGRHDFGSGHGSGIVRSSWTRRHLKFPLVKSFKYLLKEFRSISGGVSFQDFLTAWESLLYLSKCVILDRSKRMLEKIEFCIINKQVQRLIYEPARLPI